MKGTSGMPAASTAEAVAAPTPFSCVRLSSARFRSPFPAIGKQAGNSSCVNDWNVSQGPSLRHHKRRASRQLLHQDVSNVCSTSAEGAPPACLNASVLAVTTSSSFWCSAYPSSFGLQEPLVSFHFTCSVESRTHTQRT